MNEVFPHGYHIVDSLDGERRVPNPAPTKPTYRCGTPYGLRCQECTHLVDGAHSTFGCRAPHCKCEIGKWELQTVPTEGRAR